MKKGDLRVWHIPQVPMHAFHVDVRSVDEARKIIDTLAKYDLFQLENRIKPDYSNASGLEIFDGVNWSEWEDDEGNSIDDLL